MKQVHIQGLLLVVFHLVVTFESISSSPATVPAFFWSPSHRHESSNNILEKAVNYQTISPKELAKSVLYEGGWSNNLCTRKEGKQPLDFAIVFVGSELPSSDSMLSGHVDPNLLDLLKVSFTRSNFSMAFPYVAAPGKGAIENLLISEFKESCGHDLGMSNGAFMEFCSVEDEDFQRLSLLHPINDYIVSRMEKKPKEHTDLMVFCHRGPSSEKEWTSESKMLSEIMTSAERAGAKYELLYISDPFWPIKNSYVNRERFLVEGASGNESAKSENLCDEVCQIKSSLLEGLFVAIVLLIILISGLCCMMGVDTPTRFETPQDS